MAVLLLRPVLAVRQVIIVLPAVYVHRMEVVRPVPIFQGAPAGPAVRLALVVLIVPAALPPAVVVLAVIIVRPAAADQRLAAAHVQEGIIARLVLAKLLVRLVIIVPEVMSMVELLVRLILIAPPGPARQPPVHLINLSAQPA
jgi:hypothetical protein